MTIDMSQFFQVFFEETEEHLASMESLLLGLDIDHPDAEQLNAVFRAAHSIKGSAGTFGFDDLARVTHILESLLDRLRKGELALAEEMIDAFLAAGDVLKTLLVAHKNKGVADTVAVEAICARLGALTALPPSPLQPATRMAAVKTEVDAGLDLHFILDGEEAEVDAMAENLLGELALLGTVANVDRPTALGQTWHVTLRGTADADGVRALLDFVARGDSIRVLPVGSTAPGSLMGAADGAHGFFGGEIVSTPVATEAYGFFEPLPAADGAADGSLGSTPPSLPAALPAASPPTPATRRVGEASIRVGVDKADQLINLVGELVITQAMLAEAAVAIDPVRFEGLFSGLAQLERNTRDLQESVMSIRMMPISVVFSRFPRLVRELSQTLGKQVELKMLGEETELDKSLIERIADPLTHLVRNSLDHGIESPGERIAGGKPATGNITLKACHQGGNIVIEVGDDGAGLDRQRILAKARQRGLAAPDTMSDQEVWQLVFEAGFSTADQVTEVSGRGVGMDVVKRNIAALGGRVDIQSTSGIGTRMTVRLPLTLAILDGMSVLVGRETYIVPLGHVIESLQAERSMIKSVSGVKRLLLVRGEYLPVIALYEEFLIPGAITALDEGIMIIIEVEGARVALFVDAMAGQQQVVIKSLETNYRKVAGISGATIMGDGHVAMILDIAALIDKAPGAQPAATQIFSRSSP